MSDTIAHSPYSPPQNSAGEFPALHWDLFCRVIDNFGDIGVCWRLAAQLAAQGQCVRLWVDDTRALSWMAPNGAPGVTVHAWPIDADNFPWPTPGNVVIETFGCDLPDAFIARMAQAAQTGPAPVWLNLEYLSAENYVERSHRLASPQWRAPANGLMKWFFYPGFTLATGGLLRETTAPAPPLDLPRRPGELCVSLFAYPHAPLAELLAQLPRLGAPVLLLAAPGATRDALERLPLPPGVRLHRLPWLTQPDYDRLLAACDLNLVRGEDSFVRAQWAARPFLWHIYFQDDGVHADKLDAFLARHLHTAPATLATEVRTWMRWWNGLEPTAPPAWPDLDAWAHHTAHWRYTLRAQPDLVSQLLGFVAEKL